MISFDSNTIARLWQDLQEEAISLLDKKLERVFNDFDVDGNGILDRSELSKAYAQAGLTVTEADLSQAIKVLDINRDGLIDFKEFKAISVRSQMIDGVPRERR